MLDSKVKRWTDVKVLIIDEISQVTETHLLLVSERLKSYKNCQLPFGGLSVLLLGDMYRLRSSSLRGRCYVRPLSPPSPQTIAPFGLSFAQRQS